MLYQLGSYRIRAIFYFVAALLLYYGCFYIQNLPITIFTDKFNDYGHFLLVGLLAAVVANSTGAGGGIVFLPAFSLLGLTAMEALATSFAIQCFGMTSGTLAWLQRANDGKKHHPTQWLIFNQTLLLTLVPGLLGLLLVQWLAISPPIAIKKLFALLSFVLALAIIYRVSSKTNLETYRTVGFSKYEVVFLVCAAFFSGALTAWLSIGIGEIIAVILIIMGFSAYIAVAAAVTISSLSVIAGVQLHIWSTEQINTDVLLFAAPGALIGGALASRIATAVGVTKLKLFMSLWIIVSAIVYLQI